MVEGDNCDNHFILYIFPFTLVLKLLLIDTFFVSIEGMETVFCSWSYFLAWVEVLMGPGPFFGKQIFAHLKSYT